MPAPEGAPGAARRAAAGARSKIARTEERVLGALEDLLRDVPAAEISKTHICRHAGVSTDVFYAPHHRGLRETVERRLAEQVKAQAEAPGARRRRLPVSMTAAEKIAQLEAELSAVKADYAAAMQAVNVLSQVVEALSGDGDAARPQQAARPSSADLRAFPGPNGKRGPRGR